MSLSKGVLHMRLHRAPCRIASLSAAACLTAVLAGCGDSKDAASPTADEISAPSAAPPAAPSVGPSAGTRSGGSTVAVAASDTACATDRISIPSGPVRLSITNGGTKVTEVYILTADASGNATSIVTERENIAPASAADLTAELPAGSYTISCRPASGERINTGLTVTEGAATALSAEDKAAVDAYRDYVLTQMNATVAGTKELVAALKAGDVGKAKSLYAPSRIGWEAIEPVAEAFGDLDPKVDAREADLEAGQQWTGWHVIEKKLWVDGSTTGLGTEGEHLLTNLDTVVKRIPEAAITPTSMANGAKELLDEVSTRKITGEEETFSHTDLVDLKANLDGAKKIFALLKPIAEKNDAALVATLTTEFADCEQALATYADGGSYVSYDKVTETQRKELSDVVNALAEPLSRLAAAVV